MNDSQPSRHPNCGPNPYVGPRPFEASERLYGRRRETLELYDLLIAERIVMLHSPSGAGKTSLLQAALLPRLEEKRPGSPHHTRAPGTAAGRAHSQSLRDEHADPSGRRCR